MLLDKIRPLVRKNIALIFAATCLIICFAYFFSYKTVDVHNSIDGSWQYTLSELRNSPGELGKDILYTYGPLLERLAVYPVPDDNNVAFLVAAVLFTVITGAVIFSLVKFWQHYAKNKAFTWIVVLLAGYVLLTITQLDSLYYLSLFITVLAARRARSPWERAIMLTGIALFSLYKVSFSITFLIALPAIFIVSVQLKDLSNALLKWGIALAGYVVLFTAITGGGNFLTYVHTGLQNSVAYNEFMSLSFATNKEITITFAALFFTSVAVSAGVLAYTFLYKRARLRREIVFAALLIYFVAFFVFKQSVIRSDDHLLAFTPFLPLIILAPALLIYNVRTNLKITKRGVQAFAILCVFCFAGHLLLQKNLSDISPGEYVGKRAIFVKDAFVNQPLSYFAFSGTRQEITNDIAARQPEIAEIKAQLDKTYPGRPILVYGNTTILSDFLKEGRTVRQAPFVQNYAAFPPQIFDSRYIDFLKKHPDALVFVEETEASINERIPAHELNNFFMYLTHNYRVVLKNSTGTQYVLENRGTATEAACTLVQSTRQSKEAALTIPELSLSPNQYVNMKVDFPPDIVELGISTLIKKPVYNITLINQDGGAMIRRSSQSTLQHGVTVSPLFLSFRAYADNADFSLKHVIISGGITRQSHYTANFELCTFNN